MDIADYITEIEYASNNLITTIWHEHRQIEQIEKEIAKLAPLVEDNYRRAEFAQQFSEDPDDVMLGVGMYWDNYFNEDKALYHKDKGRQDLEERIAAHAFSVASLAGDLLQHAKQGISLAHGGVAGCPNGRSLASQYLKTVIWQGRNQAIHWEEGNFHPPTKKCFKLLTADFGPRFSQYTRRNMAFDIVVLLGWKTFDEFRADMMSLA